MIILLVKYFKLSPRCSGSISGPPLFGVENFQVPPPLVIYERSLRRVRLFYLELCELMLNLIYALRTGSGGLYLSCIEEVIPCIGICDICVHDRQNYARFLIPFLKIIRHLCVRMPRCTQSSPKASFPLFQMGGCNPFGRNEADKTSENIIGGDINTGGGYIGCGVNFVATRKSEMK